MGIQTISGSTLDNIQQLFSNDHSNFEEMDGIDQIQIIENKGTVLLMRTKTAHHMLDLVEVNLTFQLQDPAHSVFFRKQKSKTITPLKLHRFKVSAIFELIKRFVIGEKRKSKEKICITLALLFDPTKEPLTIESQVSGLSLKLLNQVLKEYSKYIEVDDVLTLTAKIYPETYCQDNVNYHNDTAIANNLQEVSSNHSLPSNANYIWPDFSVPPPVLPLAVHQQHPNFCAPMAPQVNPTQHLFNYLNSYPMQQPLAFPTCHQYYPPAYGNQNAHHVTPNGYYYNYNLNNNNC
jgi:hypothetical protein